jgi:hypothetical protein
LEWIIGFCRCSIIYIVIKNRGFTRLIIANKTID